MRDSKPIRHLKKDNLKKEILTLITKNKRIPLSVWLVTVAISEIKLY